MDEAHKKAQATRERNQAVRAALCQEQAQAIRAARVALARVLENDSATPGEILEAARLLVEIGK